MPITDFSDFTPFDSDPVAAREGELRRRIARRRRALTLEAEADRAITLPAGEPVVAARLLDFTRTFRRPLPLAA